MILHYVMKAFIIHDIMCLVKYVILWCGLVTVIMYDGMNRLLSCMMIEKYHHHYVKRLKLCISCVF